MNQEQEQSLRKLPTKGILKKQSSLIRDQLNNFKASLDPIQNAKSKSQNRQNLQAQAQQQQRPQSSVNSSLASKPMYHKQKLHPFDFNGEDLAEIKKIFPEFKPKRAVTRSSTKIVGLHIAELKKKLKEKIQIEGKPLHKLIQKLDHKNEEKITWSEFLTFLENEGVRREIVNDAQLYGIGVKRLTEGQRVVLKEQERVIEYYIDCLCYIEMKQFRLILALFENNAAKLMEIENFKVIQELQFQSDYAQPKDQSQQAYQLQKGKTRITRSALQGQRSFIQGNRSQMEGFSGLRRMDTVVTDYHNNEDADEDDEREEDDDENDSDDHFQDFSVAERHRKSMVYKSRKFDDSQMGKEYAVIREDESSNARRMSAINSKRALITPGGSGVNRGRRETSAGLRQRGAQDVARATTSTLNHKSDEYLINLAEGSQNKITVQQLSQAKLSKGINFNLQDSKSLGVNLKKDLRKASDMNSEVSFSPDKGSMKDQSSLSLQKTCSPDQKSVKQQSILKQPRKGTDESMRKQSDYAAAAFDYKNTPFDQIDEYPKATAAAFTYQSASKNPPSVAQKRNSKIYNTADKQFQHKNRNYTSLRNNLNRTYMDQSESRNHLTSQTKASSNFLPNEQLSTPDINNLTQASILLDPSFNRSEIMINHNKSVISNSTLSQNTKIQSENKTLNETTNLKAKASQFLPTDQMIKPLTAGATQASGSRQKYVVSQERKQQMLAKSRKKMYGVLGLTKIEDEEGSAAYLLGKDLQRERPFGLKELFPNLHQDYGRNKKKFEQLMQVMDKKIAQYPSTLDQEKSRFESIDEDTYKVVGRINSIKDKVSGQGERLEELRETNKYFYKLTSPSPYVISQQAFEKQNAASRRSRAKGNTILERDETGVKRGEELSSGQNNHCSPEMITKYVEQLNKKDGTKQKDSKLKQLIEKRDFNSEALFEQNRKNKIKHTKEVYSLCAYYHQELGILAIALIDKEIKVYKLKQNGQKVSLQEQFSFNCKLVVTCLHIEQFIVNSRPILCLGSNTGEIAIYYLDEPVINPLTGLKEPFKLRSLLHLQFNFFQRSGAEGSTAPAQVKSKIFQQTQLQSHQQSLQEQSQGNNTNGVPAYLQPGVVENELTQIRYIREIGLICTSLNGYVKIFDGFDFKEVWKTSNKTRKQVYHTSILTFDVSTGLGLIAAGGTEGKLLLIDPYAFGIINCTQAHQCEIISLYIYDEQQQIITIGQDRSIIVWDAYRLERIQMMKDVSSGYTPKFTSSAFDKQHGILYTGCQALKTWEAKVDSKVEIKALQVETLSKTILKERKMLDQINQEGKGQKGQRSKLVHGEQKTGKVLVTSSSELVDVIVNQKEDSNFLVTVDSENLLRAWSVKSSTTSFSYKLPMKKRVTAAAIDPTYQFLAIGNCIGEVQILNLKSGGVLYNLPHCEQEVTCLQFLQGMSEFWLVGGCWQGKLMMWTNPNEDNNFTVTAKCRVGHKDDVLAVDSSSQYIVSGGVDGFVSIWNLFSGILKFAIAMPPPSKLNGDGDENQAGNLSIEEMTKAELDSLSDLSEEEQTSNLPKRKEKLTKGKLGHRDEEDINDRDSILNNSQTKLQAPSHKSRRRPLQKQKSFYNEEKIILNPDRPEDQAAIQIKKTIVGLCFHPGHQNLVCVMQEGGDIHILDASNGTIAYEYVAKVKMNSNWACDRDNQRMLVVGDIGKAILFDMNLASQQTHASVFHPHLGSAVNLTHDSRTSSTAALNHNSSSFFNKSASPTKIGAHNLFGHNASIVKKKQPSRDVKWRVVKPWFAAHSIHKMETAFVVSVKYAAHIKVWITCTSKGEVKLWANSFQMDCLGVLNSANWDASRIMEVVMEVRKEQRQKEIASDEVKMEEIKRKIRQSLNNSLKI